MKVLLDDHVLLWFFAGSNQPGAKALSCIRDTQKALFVIQNG
jgi:PIN domain nuclease of toxin-antitoxin system